MEAAQDDRNKSDLPDQASTTSLTEYTSLDESANLVDFVSVRIQRTRLLLGTFGAAITLIVLVVCFHRGIVLLKFNSSEKDAKSKLVDDYNSYSANIASIFGRPIEILVGLVVQVMVLRFGTSVVLRVESKRRVYIASLLLVAILEYLVLNGLNALNVQLRPEQVHPVISMSDLSFASTVNTSMANATNASDSFPEVSVQNPISNTVLRNLVLPRATRPSPSTRKCTQEGFSSVNSARTDIADFGFPSRPWHQDMVSVALKSKTVRVPLDESSSITEAAKELPMNTSTASNLFVNAVWLATQHYSWMSTSLRSLEEGLSDGGVESAVERMGLRPQEVVDDATDREWFLEQARSFMRKAGFQGYGSIPGNLVAFELIHVDISSTIAFDAVTLEVEVDVSNVTASATTIDGTNYTLFGSTSQCGPWPGVCMFNIPPYSVQFFDTPSKVEAYSICLNEAKGDEEPYYRGSKSDVRVDCNRVSNSSMLVAAFGKRLVADTLFELVDESISGPRESTAKQSAVTNLRKVYSLTVGRLAWKESNLAAEFNADCAVHEGSGCLGLVYDLDARKNQALVVSIDKLPVRQLNPQLSTVVSNSRPLPLVEIIEPPVSTDEHENVIFMFDSGVNVLLPHNVKTLNWNMSHVPERNTCSEWVEDRLSVILDNHFYIESGLQPAYTTAMFFLFQDGTVRDVIHLSNNLSSLNFDGNIREVSLFLSIPEQNVIMTITGCLLLCVIVVGVALYSQWLLNHPEADLLEQIKTPHVMAQVLLDEGKFPPLILQRRLIKSHEEHGFQVRVDGSVVNTVTLRTQSEEADRVIELRHTEEISKKQSVV